MDHPRAGRVLCRLARHRVDHGGRVGMRASLGGGAVSDVIGFHGIPAPRRRLAQQLRELAGILESDDAETEPHGIMMCLMGATQFEVVGIGDCEGWSGAQHAMQSVLSATFDTAGGNVRMRNHRKYQPRSLAAVTPLQVAKKEES